MRTRLCVFVLRYYLFVYQVKVGWHWMDLEQLDGHQLELLETGYTIDKVMEHKPGDSCYYVSNKLDSHI
ncbi:hypothetical protein OUZ56_006362 [Daphnia magna]|uniref:Uncharacterized protein n=1 Tax=Daphnia magna TaxID=35525 RepID=A0ABQ9YVG5_9CRUS|nr:hypothetical protein OUZ56_006362 [Daphnia magna]